MSDPFTSIVVVSRGRPAALHRCLLGISQLFYHPFELVVVADAAGRTAIKSYMDRIKYVAFETVNISAARNAGLDQAAGEIVAFIDDDAIPEPSWLDHLTAPFAETSVSATAGWVRGRNGISFQSQSRTVDRDGRHTQIEHPGTGPLLLQGSPDTAPRTEGTNMAWRRSALVDLGGFDAAYRFFLDETDVNMRLARKGGTTAIIPLAQVHHGFAPSAYRRADRVPLSLFEIGASWAVFLDRYSDRPIAALRNARQDERARMIRHAIRGNVWPSAIGARLAEFDAGVADGRSRRSERWQPSNPPPFLPFHEEEPNSRSVAIASGMRGGRDARAQALNAVARGNRVSLWKLSPTSLYHKVRYTEDGYWLHSGGIWGRSDRNMPLIIPTTHKHRIAMEVAKVSTVRGISATHFIKA